MTKTVIEIAREAGITQRRTDLDLEYKLNVFAALVREDEREQLSAHLMDYNQGFVDGVEEGRSMAQQEPVADIRRKVLLTIGDVWDHETNIDDALDEIHSLYTTPPTIEAAVLAEREACAKVASKSSDNYIGAEIAAAIRARNLDDLTRESQLRGEYE